MKDPRVPKTIREHPGVSYAVTGEKEGADYKYWIELRPGWRFSRGSKGGAGSGGFDSVASFKYAEPVDSDKR